MKRLREWPYWDRVFLCILLLYPFRHICWGLDLWDTGYNYANFQYMGLEHMDPMWLYSTYLANVVGHFFSLLPFADTLVGMNFYTGLTSCALAVTGYLFCRRRLGMSAGIVFVGEMIALSLCWCPTALLYNYLTYILFLACVILLYCGLSRNKKWYLFGAGICLGANVLVRFSNLPEAALIVAVWAYAVLSASGEQKVKQIWSRAWRDTLWCLGGYLSALAVLFGYIQIRYGLDEYVAGIMRLFAMTDNATDYKATSMLMGMILPYVENLYWVLRVGVIVVGATIAIMVSGWIQKKSQRVKILWSVAVLAASCIWFFPKCISGQFPGYTFFARVEGIILLLIMVLAAFGWLSKVPKVMPVLISIFTVAWLYDRGFCSLQFYSYGSMLRPGILFLMLGMGIAVLKILWKGIALEEKLISGLILLVLLLTSIGSNNGVYPSMNNLFVAAPYTLWESYRFLKGAGEYRFKQIQISMWPAKCLLTVFLAICLFQFTLFGAEFMFAEATGVQNVTATVENNPVLRGVKMHPDRAKWLGEISEYAEQNDLQGREVIPYGDIPAMSFYLQMPAAFNPWSDLRSYDIEVMRKDLAQTKQDAEAGTGEKPVILLEKTYALYLEQGTEGLPKDVAPERVEKLEKDAKLQLLGEFMGQWGYEKTFENEKFVLFE